MLILLIVFDLCYIAKAVLYRYMGGIGIDAYLRYDFDGAFTFNLVGIVGYPFLDILPIGVLFCIHARNFKTIKL